MPKSLKISLLAVSVALILCIFVGVNAHSVAAAGDPTPQDAYNQINVYGEVLQHIQSDYVEVPNIPKVTNGALRGLLEQHMVIDYVTLRDELLRRGDLESVGGVPYLDELVNAVPTAANLEFHARILREKSIQRHLIEAATQIIERANELSQRDPTEYFEAGLNTILDGLRASRRR